MKQLLIVLAFFAVVALLSAFSGWAVNPKRARMMFRLGLYAYINDAGEYVRGTFKNCAHGPQSWAWWQLFSLQHYKLEVCEPSTGHRWWCYTRWGSVHIDVYFDRRGRLFA